MPRVGICVDVEIERSPAGRSGFRGGATPISSNVWLILGTDQSLNISRDIRESSRKSLRDG